MSLLSKILQVLFGIQALCSHRNRGVEVVFLDEGQEPELPEM